MTGSFDEQQPEVTFELGVVVDGELTNQGKLAMNALLNVKQQIPIHSDLCLNLHQVSSRIVRGQLQVV